MVNTRKGNYQAHSSKAVAEVSNTRTNMHGIRMRCQRFKSTPSQRPYRLSSEKSQVNPPDIPNLSMHDENIAIRMLKLNQLPLSLICLKWIPMNEMMFL
ncbi:uncharacterized protein E5676_scaffold314G00160 [Cucumis melo var. makuwa]|uniref:Uncharacterized protein n=1 Tax=Cucumis melo var. makuwa TaxID=1194695 RepID=A0A5A7UMF0_CUCMM|nr:uncharacterized protein E6C27_scaffold221G00160 [Cucumis melo var. makuwa]TYK08928.1 uncharacterized protein E5676_scaffold314G00160 [Cucumis melo var. makuwa]